jgi:hypothetical protein
MYFRFSFCEQAFCSELRWARNHCKLCGLCGDTQDEHCVKCNRCYQSGGGCFACPSCRSGSGFEDEKVEGFPPLLAAATHHTPSKLVDLVTTPQSTFYSSLRLRISPHANSVLTINCATLSDSSPACTNSFPSLTLAEFDLEAS